MSSSPDIQEALALVVSQLSTEGRLTEGSQDRIVIELVRFTGQLVATEVQNLENVTDQDVRDFVEGAVIGRTGSYRAPNAATQNVRRSAVRLLFKTARSLGLTSNDPARDVIVPERASRPCRPLTDDEEEACRSASCQTLGLTRLPAAWALGQATATASEMARVRAVDVDLDGGTVALMGSGRRDQRDGVLTEWGCEQIARRIEVVSPGEPLVVSGDSSKGVVVSAGAAITEVLGHAGFAGRPGVRPSSLIGWAGRKVFDRTGDLFETARTLGMRSLDRTAELIGEAWR